MDDLFCDFPFANPAADRTNLYAAIVTRVCRRSYAIAPMFRFEKPKCGTDATLLVGLVILLTAGKAPERVTYCHGEMVEFEKRVAATCRDGSSVVLLDNLSGTKNSTMLAERLTADDGDFKARDLGASRYRSFNPRNFVIMGTANNVNMTAELVNRTLQVRFNAGVERPDQRSDFRHLHVEDYLMDNLPRLRSAELSIVRHWLDKNRLPASALPKALSRYPVWQWQTAAVLEAAGFGDFAANAAELEERAVTEAGAAQHSFVQWWWETHQSNPVTIKDLAPMALGNPSDEDSEGLLNVKGNTDRIRRANLINSWLDQTYELEGATLRVASGPRHHNRYQTWILQMPDSRVGAFPLLDPDPGYSLLSITG